MMFFLDLQTVKKWGISASRTMNTSITMNPSIIFNNYELVGDDWKMTFFSRNTWEYIIIPTDELIFFRGVGIPPTSKEMLHNLPQCPTNSASSGE